LYLSKLQLNPHSAQVQADLSNTCGLFEILCCAFCQPGEPPPYFLWRLEQDSESCTVLMQSQHLPDWTRLEAPFPGHLQAVETQRIALEGLQDSQILEFRLKANLAQVYIQNADPEERLTLTNEDDQMEWLECCGLYGGFEPLEFRVVHSEAVLLEENSQGAAPILLQSVLFAGRLEITCLESFLNTLERGLGQARALGFGLVSLG